MKGRVSQERDGDLATAADHFRAAIALGDHQQAHLLADRARRALELCLVVPRLAPI